MKLQNEFCCTEDGLLNVSFVFADLGHPNGWRAYIVDAINYKAFSPMRSDRPQCTHTLSEQNDKMKKKIQKLLHRQHRTAGTDDTLYFVECKEKISTLEQLREFVQRWVNATAHYIRYGGMFPMGRLKPES